MLSKNVIFFCETLGFFESIVALFLSILGVRTCFAIQGRSCPFSRSFLNSNKIHPISFENITDIDFGVSYGDTNNSITHFVDHTSQNIEAHILTKLTNNPHSFHFYKCFLRQQAAKHIDKITSYTTFINKTFPDAKIVFASIPKERYITFLLKLEKKIYINSAFPSFVFYFFRMIILYIKNKKKNILSKKNLFRHTTPCPPKEHINSEILYFPHQGIKYSGLFNKDHFYAPDANSPLSPDKILHIEHTRWNIDNTPNQMSLPSPSLSSCLSAALNIATLFFTQSNLHEILSIKNLLTFFSTIQFCIIYKIHFKNLSTLNKAKIAIIGYDILFPAQLALALNTLQIKTIATQERYSPPVLLKFGICTDEYLCCSHYISTLLAHNPHVRCTPIGIVRTDLLYKYQKGYPKNKITVLDFHSLPNKADSEQNMLLNWKNNNAFYNDIINLAQALPEYDFVIRGKDSQWWELTYFTETRQSIERLPNLTVDRNYEELNRSYIHCAESKLVIAKYNSLVDECLALNIPVIIHDYAPTLKHITSTAFDYFGADIFATSLESLLSKTQMALDDPSSAILPASIHDTLFGNLNDGMVSSRARNHILSLLSGSNQPPTL